MAPTAYYSLYPRTVDPRLPRHLQNRRSPFPFDNPNPEPKHAGLTESELDAEIERPRTSNDTVEQTSETFMDVTDSRTLHSPSRQSNHQNMPARAATPSQSQAHFTSNGSASKLPLAEGEGRIYDDSGLPPLQANGVLEESDNLDPVEPDDPASYDLVAPAENGNQLRYSLEKRSQQLFSRDHLQIIFDDPTLLLKFTAFLSSHRPQSVPILIYYLDAIKALRAINYANAVMEALEPIEGHDFTSSPNKATANAVLEQKANNAFEEMVKEDLPAYITHLYISVVSISVSRRITGTLPSHLREASEGLAEVFCLTDPSRPDNPIVFASEEFHRTTQYGMSYVLGRNCRFLQGPWTNPLSVKRIGAAIERGKEHCEVFLNYRRDGSPFMNLLMCAPLRDSRGIVRYFIGAQVDVSGLVKECTELDSLQRLVTEAQHRAESNETNGDDEKETKDQFQELSEMFNSGELAIVRKYGGRMHREVQDDLDSDSISATSHMPRLLVKEHSPDMATPNGRGGVDLRSNGRLRGVYEHYLLIRPYPSLRILFASPSQRVPGILQSPFMNRIGGSDRVREELTTALAEGRGVTAKVKWVTKHDEEGRTKWIHCTPLLGSNTQIGVWMIVIVDDDKDPIRRWKLAPPVQPIVSRNRMIRSIRGPDEGMTNQSYPVSNPNNYWKSVLGTRSGSSSVNGSSGVNGIPPVPEQLEREGSIGGESSTSLRI